MQHGSAVPVMTCVCLCACMLACLCARVLVRSPNHAHPPHPVLPPLCCPLRHQVLAVVVFTLWGCRYFKSQPRGVQPRSIMTWATVAWVVEAVVVWVAAWTEWAPIPMGRFALCFLFDWAAVALGFAVVYHQPSNPTSPTGRSKSPVTA